MKKIFFALAVCLCSLQMAYSYPNFDKHSCLASRSRKRIKPHLLPVKHPAKAVLDRLLADVRVLDTMDSLQKAGFITVSVRPFSYCVIVKHPDLPGYLLKLYLNSETRVSKRKEGWERLVKRCEGAEQVRNAIRKNKLKHFSVPGKWLYPLAVKNQKRSHSSRKKCGQQPIVLVATDMNLVSQEETHLCWKTKIKRKHLRELYHVLNSQGASCHVAWNIPRTNQGQFACIDTEHPNRLPKFWAVKHYLSDEMAAYWDRLVQKKSKK